jgi:hypothetical protein
MLVIVIKGLPEESRLDGRSTPRRLQIPPLRSCGAPVDKGRAVTFRKIATRMDGVRSGYSAKTADPLRSCGAPVGMTRVGHLACKKGAQKRDKRGKSRSYLQPCRSLLDHGGFATGCRQGRTLPYAWNHFCR